MDVNKTYSFPTACIDFFGKLPNQDTASFAAELKKLNEQDRAEIRAALIEKGYRII